MVSESSRVAALFGFLGLAVGAIGGAWVDNKLQRHREIEKIMFDLRKEGMRSFLKGQAGVGGIDIEDNTQVTAIQRTNYGRILIAMSASPNWVKATHDWIKEESKVWNNVRRCTDDDISSFGFYHNLREQLFNQSGDSFFGTSAEPVSQQLIGEVAVRCLVNVSKN